MKDDKKLIILRGLPGSGKSTITAELVRIATELKISHVVVCCDDFFMVGDSYVFDQSKLKQVHDDCLIKAQQAMDSGVQLIIVDNTNVCYEELCPYVQYGLYKDYIITFQEPANEHSRNIPILLQRNIHGVPAETYASMWARWQETDDIIDRLSDELGCEADYVTGSIWS